MIVTVSILLALSACGGPKGSPTDTGGASVDTGSGGDDSEGESPTSGCDSADRTGGDTADPDTGDSEDRCDGDLLGVRDVKLCGVGQAYAFGYDVSAGKGALDEATVISVGSSPYGLSDDRVEANLWITELQDVWLADGIRIFDDVEDQTRFFGRALESGSDLNGDGFTDLGVSAFAASTDGWGGGMVDIYYGPYESSIEASAADALVTNDAHDFSATFGGTSMTAVPDIDNDGDDELLTGGYYYTDDPYFNVPTLLLGPISSMDRVDAAATYLDGSESNSSPGTDTATGDIDGDGVADLLLSQSYYRPFYGKVYVIPADLRGDVLVDDLPAVVGGEDEDGLEGVTIAAGDVNADGYDDLIADRSPTSEGTLFTSVWFGPIPTSVGTEDATATFVADASVGYLRPTVAGDLDGDCVPGDLVFSLLNSSQVHLYPAPLLPGTYTPADDASLIARTAATDDALGWAMAPLPDQDIDGVDDLLLGAPNDDEGGHNAGAAYVLYGASW